MNAQAWTHFARLELIITDLSWGCSLEHSASRGQGEIVRNARIFINDTVQSRQEQRGVTRYTDKVVEALVAEFSDRVTVLSTAKRDYRPARHLRPLHFAGRYRLNFLLRDGLASLAAWSQRATIFFSPYFGNARTNAAEVYTVYDMIHELHPQYFGRNDPHVRVFVSEKRRCIEGAACLMAISACTAHDILACYPHIDAAKIKVIPLGVDDFFLQGQAEALSHRRPYFLYVGQRALYKNFVRLLKAFQISALAADYDLMVLSPSGDGFSNFEFQLLRDYGLRQSVRLRCGVTDAELRAYYTSACALVYPSEYEGFGLPILEALASGTLVLTSNRASMPEVGGTAPYYVDPFNEEELAAGLCTVANVSEGERLTRVREGKNRAQAFTWQSCQRAVVDLFRQLI